MAEFRSIQPPNSAKRIANLPIDGFLGSRTFAGSFADSFSDSFADPFANLFADPFAAPLAVLGTEPFTVAMAATVATEVAVEKARAASGDSTPKLYVGSSAADQCTLVS